MSRHERHMVESPSPSLWECGQVEGGMNALSHPNLLQHLHYKSTGDAAIFAPDPPASFSSDFSQTCTTKTSKQRRSRLQCAHPGCKRTFPRKFELQRHQDGVHSLKVAILCPVYGCNRVAKPFPRKDKFWEHMRSIRI